jgi:hypothetical protein
VWAVYWEDIPRIEQIRVVAGERGAEMGAGVP